MYRLSLASLLILKFLILAFVIVYGEIGLSPDEAQYWTWSKELDWGYYSKPPGIAWLIAIGTYFLGDTELGVRIVALVIGILLPLAVWKLAISSGLRRMGAYLAALMMAFTPMGIIASLLATTDGPLTLFWVLSCIVIVKALHEHSSPSYLLLGALILCGALFKWPIYLLWVVIAVLIWLVPTFYSPQLYSGIGISLLGLLPSFLWNAGRGFPTFQHVWTTMIGGHQSQPNNPPLVSGNFFDFIGAQIALVSPIIFVLLILALIRLYKKRGQITPALLFCGGMTTIIVVIYSILSIFMKMQGNWCVFAYPTAFVVISWYSIYEIKHGVTWVFLGIILSILLSAFTLTIPSIQANNHLSSLQIPYCANPFRDCLGWRKLPQALLNNGYRPDEDFLFSDSYQMSSLLSFYGPGQKRAYFINLGKSRKNQFSYWPGLEEEQVGKNGLFVRLIQHPSREDAQATGERYQKLLTPYFESVKFMEFQPLFTAYEKIVKGADILQCREFNGKELPNYEIY